MNTHNIAVLGLGTIGGAIAASLVEHGWHVNGYDVDGERSRLAAGAGVYIADTVEQAISSANVIFTSLPSAVALEAVAQRIATSTSAKVAVEMSTLALADKFKFRANMETAGNIALDCPISGTGAQAQRGDLVIYASGQTRTIQSLLPVFSNFAKEVFDVGQFGNGSKMKYVANTLVAIHNVASAEAVLLAKRAGLDAELAVRCLAAGAGSSVIFAQRAPMMAKGSYKPASMKLSLFQKDLEIIREFAASCEASMPLFSAALPVYERAIKLGLGHCDTAAVLPAVEEN